MNDATPAASPLPLRRSTSDRVLGGVCGGIATTTGLDPTLVRLVTILLVLCIGTGGIAYVVAWLLMPVDDGRPSAAQRLLDRVR